jgi:acetylornithine deacetylase/succinyl-diaminopimelate desuccinylase-like protein
MSPARALDYARRHRARFVDELAAFVRFPSVSAQPAHAGDVRACAGWLAGKLRDAGLERVEVVPTPGHPSVLGEWRHVPRRPTVLIYGHYDVQPPEPLADWSSPPFEPRIRGEDLHGRGASDDKGQLWAHVKAIESSLRGAGALPVNVVCLFEGEEEIGSTNLGAVFDVRRDALAADAAVISDTRILGPDRPAITYALRGKLAFELELRGSAIDLHSGGFGGAVHNPAQALCELIAGLHDARGRIAIPGLYDSVRDWSEAERARMARSGPDDARILRDARSLHGWGERGYSLQERTTIRPALAVTSLRGGYQGPGGKAIIPARASAKFCLRLVPDQDPQEIERLVRRHLGRVVPPTVRHSIRVMSAAAPALMDRGHPLMRAARFAYGKAFGRPPVFLRSGGTIPLVGTLQERLGIPTVLMGFALPDDRMHAPNEKFHLPTFGRALETILWFLAHVGQDHRAAPSSGGGPAMRSRLTALHRPGLARQV